MLCVSARLYPLSWDNSDSGDGPADAFLIWARRAMAFLRACSAQNVTLKTKSNWRTDVRKMLGYVIMCLVFVSWNFDFPPTHLSSQLLVQHWGSACHFWQRRSCTACTENSCPPKCVWCRTPGPPGGAECTVAGWRSRPAAPEDEVSGSPGSYLKAKRGFVSCSSQVCKTEK